MNPVVLSVVYSNAHCLRNELYARTVHTEYNGAWFYRPVSV